LAQLLSALQWFVKTSNSRSDWAAKSETESAVSTEEELRDINPHNPPLKNAIRKINKNDYKNALKIFYLLVRGQDFHSVLASSANSMGLVVAGNNVAIGYGLIVRHAERQVHALNIYDTSLHFCIRLSFFNILLKEKLLKQYRFIIVEVRWCGDE